MRSTRSTGSTGSTRSPRQYIAEAVEWAILYTHTLPHLHRLSEAARFDNASWQAHLAEQLDILEGANNRVFAFYGVPECAKETHRAFKELAYHLRAFATLMREARASAEPRPLVRQAEEELELALRVIYSLGIEAEKLAKSGS